MLVSRLLKEMIHIGTLEIIDANGRHHIFSGASSPEATVRLQDRALHYKLFFNPYLYLGEAYMDGTLIIEKGTLLDFLEIVTRNLKFGQALPLHSAYDRFSWLLRRLQQHNPVVRAPSLST